MAPVQTANLTSVRATTLMVAAVAAHAAMSFTVATVHPLAGLLMTMVLVLNACALALSFTRFSRLGGQLFFISSVCFLPVGFLGMLAARRALDEQEAQPDLGAPQAQFFASARVLDSNRFLAIILIALGVVGFVIKSSISFLAGIGVVLLVVTAWARRHPLVSMYTDQIVIKRSIGAPRKRVNMADVVDFDTAGDPRAKLLLHDGKALSLPSAALDETNRQELFGRLKAICPQKSSSPTA